MLGMEVAHKNNLITLTILKVKVLVADLYPTLSDPRDCSPPGSSVHEILQARILVWVAIPFSRGSAQPRIGPGSPALQADSLPNHSIAEEIDLNW